MIEEKIRILQKEINNSLDAFLEEKIRLAKAGGMPPQFLEVIDNVRMFMMRGGKRLRPVLFYYGYVMAGGEREEAILRCSLAMEFLHAYFLIHDDIIDQDNMRHGGPSLHYKYHKDYEKEFAGKDTEHFGVSIAIIAGDIVSTWGYEILAQCCLENDRKLAALEKLTRIDEETSVGQIMDEFLEMGKAADENVIYEMQKYKTAKYSVCGPIQLGAILAGAGKAELDFIERFSIPLGIAYQIRDDILGLFGDDYQTGKPVGADIREGKKTLLVYYALEHAAVEEKEFLLSCLGDENLSGEKLTRVRKIIVNRGSLQYSENRINELAEEFLNNLKSGEEKFVSRYAVLEDVADYLLQRKK